MIFSRRYRLKCHRFRYRFLNTECSGKHQRRKIYFSYNSLSFSLSRPHLFLDIPRTELERDTEFVRTILGNSWPCITRRFTKFFPVVKRSAFPLKILATVSREYSFFIMKRWKASPAGKIKSGLTLPREKDVPSRENTDRYLAQKIQEPRELAWIQLKPSSSGEKIR